MITHEYVLSRENRACLAPRVSLHLRALLLCHPQSLSGVALLACACVCVCVYIYIYVYIYDVFIFTHTFTIFGVSLVAQMVENLPAVQKTWVRSLVWEDPLEKEIAAHSSVLAWRIPGAPGRLQSMRLQRVKHD